LDTGAATGGTSRSLFSLINEKPGSKNRSGFFKMLPR
jgi:hypothetical protein